MGSPGGSVEMEDARRMICFGVSKKVDLPMRPWASKPAV